MSSTHPPDQADQPRPPGKTRTWWHALLVRLLDYVLSARYEVRDEVPVGRVPLRIDVVLIQRGEGEVPEHLAQELRAIIERLNLWTLIEFKGPTDALECGDLDQLLGGAHLFCAQQSHRIPSSDLTLIMLAPALTDGLRKELHLRGWTAQLCERGVYRIQQPAFETWLIEADAISGPDEPVLTLFSRSFLRDRERIMHQLQQTGHSHLLYYVLQQIEQFKRAGEQFMIQHTDTSVMDDIEKTMRAHVLETASPEERLRGLPAEQVLRHVSLEDRLAGLSREELERLRELLDRRTAGGG